MTYKALTPQIDTRLAGYAALASIALATPVAANADIVYSGLLNLSVPNNFDGIYINFVTGVTGSSSGAVPGANWNPYNSGTGVSFFWNGSPNGGLSLDGGSTYAALTSGTSIGAGNTFIALTSAAATATWRAGQDAYLGVRFLNSANSATDFGWVHLSTTGATGFPLTIIDYAYENTGASILAGQTTSVPEPSSFALLGVIATGAAAVRAMRKKQA